MEMKPDNIDIPPQVKEELFNILTILKEVEWTEPCILGLIIFHAAITALTLITRNRGNFQACFFCILLVLVYFSENLNEMGANNWKYFARHQYFDSGGFFISTVFSVPLLLNCLIMVGQWLWASGMLMVKLKQAQLREQLRERRLSRAASQTEDNSKKTD